MRTPGGYGVRVDSGVYAGYEVTPHYDPLLAKLIVHGSTRQIAIKRLDRALSEFVINGIDTNVRFLRRIVQHEAFQAGRTDTGFIARHIGEDVTPDDGRVRVAMIAAAIRQFVYSRELADKIVAGGTDDARASRWRQLGRTDAFTRYNF
jgi:acetyl-CoA carboxylase biotin carboxylase subunit